MMLTFLQQTHGSPSYLTAISLGSAVVIGFTLLQWSSSRGAKVNAVQKKKRQKKVLDPAWSIRKAEYLNAPSVCGGQFLEELNRRRPPRTWNTVVFFPALVPKTPEPLNQLKKYFEAAKVSIHICVYLCSLHEMSNLIRDKYLEGLVVLIITDYDTWTAHNNCGLKILAGHGIQVRLTMNGYLMHNKFSIIDEEAVLTGSLNWTKQGARTNNENVAVTTDPRITSKYVEEFNSLWLDSKNVEDASIS